jgi:hypothetical protein
MKTHADAACASSEVCQIIFFMKGTLNPMRNLPPPAAVFNVLLRSACRHFLLIGAIALGTGLIHAGEQKKVFSGNFSKGHLDGWTAPPTVVAISGKGLESIGPIGLVTRQLERPTGKKGRWVYKAKVWPKGQGGHIIIGFLPQVDGRGKFGLSVVIHSAGGVFLFSGPGHAPFEGGNLAGQLKGVPPLELGKLPYSLELAYSTTPPAATLSVNGNVVAYDIPTAYGGVVEAPPPEESFAFAAILFTKQNDPKDGGRVESASVEWVPAR